MSHRVVEFYNIMPIVNIPSVLQHGILSHERCSKLEHVDVSMEAIQERRDAVQIPGGMKLHQYANLYFDARNPMMYKRSAQAPALCVLRINTTVLEQPGCVLADRNASSDYVRFLSPAHISFLDFDKIYAPDWRHPDDRIAYYKHRSQKCAEILIPNVVEPQYIQGAYVVNTQAQQLLLNAGFDRPVEVKPDIFFW